MTCIIIEDEPLAMERMKNYVAKLPFLTLSAHFDNAIDALSYLNQHSIDLIFLDINIGELTGIQLLESKRMDSQVIITTAYPDYALKGYELKVTDYLLKPFTFERFLQAVNHAQELANKTKISHKNFFFVKTEHRLEKILLEEVLYIEGMGDYRRIHCKDKKIMTLQTFGELEQLIDTELICRVHKSYMVSIAQIQSIEKERIKIGEILIPISESYKETFYKLLK